MSQLTLMQTFLLAGAEEWELCLPAEAGEDATRPRAQFAIWIVMVMTFSAVSLLLLGAVGVFVRGWLLDRWHTEEEYDEHLLPIPDDEEDPPDGHSGGHPGYDEEYYIPHQVHGGQQRRGLFPAWGRGKAAAEPQQGGGSSLSGGYF